MLTWYMTFEGPLAPNWMALFLKNFEDLYDFFFYTNTEGNIVREKENRYPRAMC